MVEEESQYTDGAIVDLWTKFLKGYKSQDDRYIYFDTLQRLASHGRKTLYVNYEHLADPFQIGDDKDQFFLLRKMTSFRTEKARENLKTAAFALLLELDQEYAQSIARVFRAEFMNAPIEKGMTEIRVEDAGTFVRTAGIVQEYDEKPSTIVHSIAWKCPEGHITETQNDLKPKKCIYPNCDSIHLWKDDKDSKFEDFIRFRLQQRSDHTFDKKDPTELDFETFGPDNVNLITRRMGVGDYVSVDGIVRTQFVKRTSGQGKMVGEPYIEACYVEPLPESRLITTDPQLVERMRRIYDHKNEESYVEKLINSVCPSILLERFLRLVILLLVVGSDALDQEDGTRVRGELQVMVVGDPGLGKSHIAQWIRMVRERVLYNSAGKSTSVGLMGGYIRDKDGVGKIRSGVFGNARGGGVILDEFGDRPDADYQNLLEPLSDMQSISIAKGASYRTEVVNTFVYAITNPSTRSRYFDPNRSILDNTNIPSTILQRFDGIFVRRDIADAEQDEAKARWYFGAQTRSLLQTKDKNYFSAAEMRALIQFLRETYHPRFAESAEAIETVVNWYAKMRGFKITIAKDSGKFKKDDPDSTMDIPAADLRDLGAILRFSQAHARMRQSDFVSKEDVQQAIEIVNISLAEAGHHRIKEDGTKEFVSSEIARHNEMVKLRNEQQQRKFFEDALDKLTWRKCPPLREGGCGGNGSIHSIGEEEARTCTVCDNSSGYISQEFYKQNLLYELGLDRTSPRAAHPLISGKVFDILWTEYTTKKFIIPEGPNRWRNTTPRLMREPHLYRVPPKEDELERLRRRIAESRPNRTNQLDSLK